MLLIYLWLKISMLLFTMYVCIRTSGAMWTCHIMLQGLDPLWNEESTSDLTFVGLCIVIYFYSKANKMHKISNLFYFGAKLYMFWMVFPSIIRSLRLYTASGIVSYRLCSSLLVETGWNSIPSPPASSRRTCMTYT
jgi:hypothetical protein